MLYNALSKIQFYMLYNALSKIQFYMLYNALSKIQFYMLYINLATGLEIVITRFTTRVIII